MIERCKPTFTSRELRLTLTRASVFVQRAINARLNPHTVSVIIPFHGAESDLRRCLAALVAQSTHDFEVIVVADGVPVAGDVGDELRASGCPVRLIRNNRQSGPFAARRLGARLAVGEYLWFVDHDDSADPNFMSTTLTAARENCAEIIECPMVVVTAGTNEEQDRWTPNGGERLQGEGILAAYLSGRSKHNLCNKLIQRRVWAESLDSLERDLGDGVDMLVYAEDMLCTVYIYSHATSYGAVDGTRYLYHSRPDSTMNTRDRNRIAQSMRSLARVMAMVYPRICQRASPTDLATFLDRQLRWCLDDLQNRASEHRDSELDELASSLRARYLGQSAAAVEGS